MLTMTPMTLKEKLPEIFTYHPPVGNLSERCGALRQAALVFAQAIIDNTPPCADQTAAIRHVRDAVMTANAAIALNGLV
jgi:hypothetical protein